jgi:hypothetical protein
MRVFRVKRSSIAFLLIALAAAFSPGSFLLEPVFAQSGAPIPLYPTPNLSSGPDSTPAPPLPLLTSPPASENGIQTETLAPIDPSWTGTLGAADRALPRDMWSTTPRSFVAAALPLLQPTSSPVLQELTRRLLLSDAAAPRGQDPDGGPSLVDRRVDRVLAFGYGDGAALVTALPQTNVSETFDRDTVELRVVAGDLGGACGAVNDRARRYSTPWWNEAVIGCQALTGAYDQASLGLNAMRDQKTDRDPVFETLINAIMGHRGKLDKFPDPSPFRMTLLAAAKLPLPADALANAGPGALAVWATSNKESVAARLAAGEKAEALGALPPAGLGLIYSAVEFKPEEQGALLKSGKLPDDPRSRAILYDLARTNEPGALRVAALAPLIADARRRGTFVPMARLIAPLVIELQPSSDLQSFAPDAARVLLASGAYDRAAPWVALARRAELNVIANFVQIGGNDNVSVVDAIAALKALDAEAASRQADLLVSLAAALNIPLKGVDLATLLRGTHAGTMPNGTLWLDQRQAAKAGRLGETLLTTILLASAGDRLSAEPIVLSQAIAGLEAVGLDADARALAVEAALDAGI